MLSGEQIEHQSTNKRKSSLFEAQVSRNFRLGESYSKIIEDESTTIHNPPLLQELRSEALSKEVICDNCGAIVENGHKFCGQCGQRVTINEAKSPEVSLVRIHGGGTDGATYKLGVGQHTIGRQIGEILFPDDPFVDGEHARISVDEKGVTLHDLDSVNGVFLRMRHSKDLETGAQFLAGEELLLIENFECPKTSRDSEGTYFFGSTLPKAKFKIRQVLEGGYTGGAIMARGNAITIGREGVDIEFPDDRFISGRHCTIEVSGSGHTLTDLGSRNGTFVQIDSEATLSAGDFIFLGRQLLRVDISGAFAKDSQP